MVMFTSYIIAITRYSDYVPCSCGGALESLTWNQHLLFNIGFLLLALIGIILSTKKTEKMKVNKHFRVSND